MTNLHQLTIHQARAGLKTKQFSALELTMACLGQIKETEPKVNALLTICEKEALRKAKEIDQSIKTDQNLKALFKQLPLLGIPIVIKDLFCTKNIKTTAASKVLENYSAQYDATVTKKLKEAGAVIIAKSNLDAWAHGASGENSDFGPTKNPWDLKLVAGGSSSGSAAAVAIGMGLAATGTDTGGSIRLPSSFCNIVGLKPTYGRVSRYGVIAMASSFDSIGHLTKDVADSALILGVTAGNDPHDATTPAIKVPGYLNNLGRDIKGLKIGVVKEHFQKGIDSQVKETTLKSIKIFEKLGVKIVNVSLPHSGYAIAAYYVLVPSEVSSNLARYDGIRYGAGREKFSDEAKRRIMIGTYALSAGYYDAYYAKAMKVRRLIIEDFNRAFKKVDIILEPTSPTLPFKIGEKVDDPLKMYLMDALTAPANLAGIPGLALPAGFANHLPVGIQLLGPQFEEAKLFQAGYAYQQMTSWHQERPKI